MSKGSGPPARVPGDAGAANVSALANAYPFREPTFQRSRVSLKFGKRANMSAEIRITSGGLLAVGGLVSAILLSTAFLVRTAIRESKA